MAKSEFKIAVQSTKITTDAAKLSAQQKDARNAQFHVSANTDEIMTLTGEFFEKAWTRGDSAGTILLVGASKSDKKTIEIPFGFFRTKVLREENGDKTFEAAFDKDESFENMVNGMTKGKKIQLKRGDYVYPGRSSARSIDTIIFVD